MFEINPIFLLLILIISSIIVIKKCIIERKFYKELLLFNFVLIFAYAMVILFYDNIRTNEIAYNIYNYSSLLILLVVTIFFYFISSSNIDKKSFVNNILMSLENNTYYLLLNKNNKVLEISTFLANKFGIEKDEIIGKQFDIILNKYITIETINDKQVSNNEFLLYIKDSIPKDLNSKLEIKFLKEDGSEDTIIVTESSIYATNKYFGRMYIGTISETFKPKVLVQNDNKFNALLNISNEGIFHYSFSNNSIKVNDYLVKTLGLVGNTISFNDILYNFNKDEYEYIKNSINNSTRENCTISSILEYTLKDGSKIFLKLHLNIIFDGLNKVDIIGTVIVNNNKQFINLNSSVLDNMKLEDVINSDIRALTKTETKFEVVTFKILDIKEINNKYSRQVGTLIIEEYIRSIINVFNIKETIYRVSGTRFVFILTDLRQMEKLTRALANNKLLTPTLNYGHINIKLNVIMGLSFSNDSIRKDEIYTNSKYALKKCMEQKKQYLFYRDLLE